MVKLGQKVKDSITGLKGIAVARCEYLYGYTRIQVQPQCLKDNGTVDAEWFDEPQLTVLRKKIHGNLAGVPSLRNYPDPPNMNYPPGNSPKD